MADKKSSAKTSSGFTKEEELLLNDFSRNVSTKSSALFYGNALIVSAIPICKCYTKKRLCRHVTSQFQAKRLLNIIFFPSNCNFSSFFI